MLSALLARLKLAAVEVITHDCVGTKSLWRGAEVWRPP